MIRKLSARILTVGWRSTNSPSGRANASMKTIEIRIAVTITQRWSTMPTAVMIESSENTMSSIMICTTTAPSVAVPAAVAAVATEAGMPAPSIFWWISCVALAIRNRPPPIRMMSRHENAWPSTENSGAVRPTIQAMASSNASRVTAASRMPMLRALLRCAGGTFAARIEMKMMLSMPSTSSSAVRVASAIQSSGFASWSMGCGSEGCGGG